MTTAVREGRLGSSNYDMTDSRVWMKAGKGSSRPGEQNLAYSGSCWENGAVRVKDAQENWLILKENSLKAQQQTILLCRKMGNFSRRPAWLGKGFLVSQ